MFVLRLKKMALKLVKILILYMHRKELFLEIWFMNFYIIIELLVQIMKKSEKRLKTFIVLFVKEK